MAEDETNNKIMMYDLLFSNKEYDKNLKLVFHNGWEFDKNNDKDSEELKKKIEGKNFSNLLDMYQSGNKETIVEIMAKNKGSNNRLKEGDFALIFIPYDKLTKTYLLINAFKVNDASGELVDSTPAKELEKYFGRLVVKYKSSRNITRTDKKIITEEIEVSMILDTSADKMFRGYDNVSLKFSELKDALGSLVWKDKLSHRQGVYVITDTEAGKNYIGSATGEKGFYGRWCDYVNGVNHPDTYPNEAFKEIIKDRTKGPNYIKEHFQYSILEHFDMGVDKDFILEREGYWKRVLNTKNKGYNCN